MVQGSLSNERYARILAEQMECPPIYRKAATEKIMQYLEGRFMINAIERGKYIISVNVVGTWAFQSRT